MTNKYLQYYNSLGYKITNPTNLIPSTLLSLITVDFQRKVFPNQPREHDGIIGPKTRAMMDKYNKDNYCPEVFKPIKPYIEYSDEQIEKLMRRGLVGYGYIFNAESKKNDFDVLHNIAHARLESADGTSAIALQRNNLYGWRAYDSSPMASAIQSLNFKQSIVDWSEWFNRQYLMSSGSYYNGNHEYGVNVRYATSPIAGINKAWIVRTLLEDLDKPLVDADYKLAPNFRLGEFSSRGQLVPREYMDNVRKVAKNLQIIRDHYNKPVYINSGWRSPEHNKAVGGASSSQHLYAKAADIKIVGISLGVKKYNKFKNSLKTKKIFNA